MPNTYGPKGQLLWDSWFYKLGGRTHAFYLQALPSSDPELKHDLRVTIGHAITDDLVNFTELPTALEPGGSGAWDSRALWTGSVIEKDETFHMFYTGRRDSPDQEWIQRIGLATTRSEELTGWKKYGKNPILEASGMYAMDNKKNALEKIGTFRDPYAFYDPLRKKYYMTISARLKGQQREYNGCVALAESSGDLAGWKLVEPIFAPGVYDEIECTQVIYYKGLYYLFFSTWESNYEPDFAARNGKASGLHCYYADDLFGPYWPANNNGIVSGNGNEMYDIRLIEDSGRYYNALGWLKTPEGKYSGRMSLPFKIAMEGPKVIVTA